MKLPLSKSRNQFLNERLEYNSHFSIILTSYCNISCKHCMPESGPFLKGKTLGINQLKKVISGLGLSKTTKNVCFTGGEPFTHFDLLVEASELCNESNLNVTIMTNGFWAKNVEIAKAIITKIPNLVHIGFSTDKFHLDYLPIEVIINGIKACNEMGISCSVRVSYLDDFEDEINHIVDLLSEVKGMFVLEHQPVQDYGRATKEIDPEELLSLSTTNTICSSADVHALNYNGKVAACCGPSLNWNQSNPLHLGNINDESIENILHKANENVILQIIRIWGPSKIFKLAKEQAINNSIEYSYPEINTMCKMCEFVTNDELTLRLIDGIICDKDFLSNIKLKRLLDFGEV